MVWTHDMHFSVCFRDYCALWDDSLMITSYSGEESLNTRWLGNGWWNSILSYLNVFGEKQSQIYICYILNWLSSLRKEILELQKLALWKHHINSQQWSKMHVACWKPLKTNEEPHENFFFLPLDTAILLCCPFLPFISAKVIAELEKMYDWWG